MSRLLFGDPSKDAEGRNNWWSTSGRFHIQQNGELFNAWVCEPSVGWLAVKLTPFASLKAARQACEDYQPQRSQGFKGERA